VAVPRVVALAGGLVFVQPAIVLAWQRTRFRNHWARLSRKEAGRLAIPKELRELIRDISTANPQWGTPRILGELRKLGIPVAKSTIEKYRVRPRRPSLLPPGWPS
jgi:putative transposase